MATIEKKLRFFLSLLWMGVLTLPLEDSAADENHTLADPVAYATAVQAAIYGHAPEGMLQRLSAEVVDPVTRKASFNEHYHYTTLSTPNVSSFRWRKKRGPILYCALHIPLNPAADSERIRPPLGVPRRRASVVCLEWPTSVRFRQPFAQGGKRGVGSCIMHSGIALIPEARVSHLCTFVTCWVARIFVKPAHCSLLAMGLLI